IRIVAAGNLELPGRGRTLVARRELVQRGGLTRYADLRGKRIVLPSEPDLVGMMVDRALELGGLTGSDANLLYLEPPLALDALREGRADVAFLPEPMAAEAVDQ